MIDIRLLFTLVFLATFQLCYAAPKSHINVVTELFSPYQTINTKGELSGFSVDVVNALFAKTQDEYEVAVLPWSVAYKKALANETTMIFSIARHDIRENKFKWVGELHSAPLKIWALSTSNIGAVNSLEELKGYTLGILKDTLIHQYLTAENFNNLYVFTAMEDNFAASNELKILFKGRADLIIEIPDRIFSGLVYLGHDRSSIKEVYVANEINNSLAIAFSLSTPDEIVDRYRNAFKQLQQSGLLKQLERNWGLTNCETC